METAVLNETTYELKQEALAQIGVYVQRNLPVWLKETGTPSFTGYSTTVDNQVLLERIVRVEEGLKNHGDILEKILHQMDKRFEQVDKRFEEMRIDMNTRFEQVDKRFEEMRADMNTRFEQVDKRFEQMHKSLNNLFFYITTTGVMLAGIMTLYKFIPV